MLRTVQQKLFSRRTWQRGAAGAEFVATLPLWVLFISGIMSLIMVIYARLAVMTAAGDAALLGAQQPGDPALRSSFMWDKPVDFDSGRYGVTMGSFSASGYSEVHSDDTPLWVKGLSDRVWYSFSFPDQPYKSDWKSK